MGHGIRDMMMEYAALTDAILESQLGCNDNSECNCAFLMRIWDKIFHISKLAAVCLHLQRFESDL